MARTAAKNSDLTLQMRLHRPIMLSLLAVPQVAAGVLYLVDGMTFRVQDWGPVGMGGLGMERSAVARAESTGSETGLGNLQPLQESVMYHVVDLTENSSIAVTLGVTLGRASERMADAFFAAANEKSILRDASLLERFQISASARKAWRFSLHLDGNSSQLSGPDLGEKNSLLILL